MTTVHGRVAGLSNFYSDGVERQEIHVPLPEAHGLPHVLDKRIIVELRVGKQTVAAGIRSKRSNNLAWVCPDVRRPDGTKGRLADVLRQAGLHKNYRVRLHVDGSTVMVTAE